MFGFFKKKVSVVEVPLELSVESLEIPVEETIDAVVIPIEPIPTAGAKSDLNIMEAVVEKKSWQTRLTQGLAKTRDKIGKSLATVFGGGKIDEALYEELEAVLLMADMGVAATHDLLEKVRQRVSLRGLKEASELREVLKTCLLELILPLEQSLGERINSQSKPFVMMMTGVNGAGKTTSIGKLACHFQQEGRSVLLAAGDTFRAAAREQLIAWGNRNQIAVIAQESGDAAAVCFDAIKAAHTRQIDVVLADTAGRLPTQLHLMAEIAKVKRVIQKADENAPHEVILVLDANTGQNAINQVLAFDDALGLTGLILTKLDGTAKGGVIAAIAKMRPIPIYFIGVGEGLEDLQPFKAQAFVDALFAD
ncbi:MAG: signal recognition particle-docking protein FtsY [Neisseriaceae bacterium]|nr:signal recognition particle-docking protein FtsY [Neisseriaceae bacterium]